MWNTFTVFLLFCFKKNKIKIKIALYHLGKRTKIKTLSAPFWDMENMKYEDQLNLWCEKYLPKSFKQDKKKKSLSAMLEHGFKRSFPQMRKTLQIFHNDQHWITTVFHSTLTFLLPESLVLVKTSWITELVHQIGIQITRILFLWQLSKID